MAEATARGVFVVVTDHHLPGAELPAADAIVTGDIQTLRELLAQDPSLITARSPRTHNATLLHYVAANGIEGFRQKTPANIVEITRLLLNAGADIEATSHAYGGPSTVLGLAATSVHPVRAGVDQPLLETLLDYGASIDTPPGAILGCLANGRGAAATLLASHGARLDLETAAGAGKFAAAPQISVSVNGEPLRTWTMERTGLFILEADTAPGVPPPSQFQASLQVLDDSGVALRYKNPESTERVR